jgi:hypothetical protein
MKLKPVNSGLTIREKNILLIVAETIFPRGSKGRNYFG